MSATDELRRLLDERGVEWRKPSPEYWVLLGMPEGDSSTIVGELSIEEATDGTLVIWNATPEQAVEATLGSLTEQAPKDSEKGSDGRGECRRVQGRKSYRAYGGYRIECSECGYGLADKRYRFCPNCGRKVVGE